MRPTRLIRLKTAYQGRVKVAWGAAVEDGQAADAAGVGLGEAEGEEAAVVVADQVHRVQVQRVQQPGEAGDLGVVVEGQVQGAVGLAPSRGGPG